MNIDQLEAAEDFLLPDCLERGFLLVTEQDVHRLFTVVSEPEEINLVSEWISRLLGIRRPVPVKIEPSQLVSAYWSLYINPIEKEERRILDVIERSGGVGLIIQSDSRPREIHLGLACESKHSVFWPRKSELEKVVETGILIKALNDGWSVSRRTGLGTKSKDDFAIKTNSLSELEEIVKSNVKSIEKSE